MKLLITDLDNTLYDWATFFSVSFQAMAEDLANLLDMDIESVLDEFKAIHQHYGNTEQPFAILELPCVKKRFGDLCPHELTEKLNRPLHTFNSNRKRILALYEGVEQTLKQLYDSGVVIVGVTEAMPENAYYRMVKLNIAQYFKHLYAVEGKYLGHPIKEREQELKLPMEFVRIIPKNERKPNPQLLIDICESENANLRDALYVGDSLTKDILMANEAGVKSVWARYGTRVDPSLWGILVRVTHWTDEDVKRESELKQKSDLIKPDYTVDSFAEILNIS